LKGRRRRRGAGSETSVEYLAANPGSTYESLHESLINYGDNKMPEFLTCCHEESAVAMAHVG
jgi:thiamine pyrophosphate-dependent acetolactate synthase large subunit-like protein